MHIVRNSFEYSHLTVYYVIKLLKNDEKYVLDTFFILLRAFLQSEVAQLHLLMNFRTIFLIILYKIYELPYNNVGYLPLL